MSELIINGVNFLDPRMIGLKCWFRNSGAKGEWLDTLEAVHINSNIRYCTSNRAYEFCRLAQGDKTEYDGNGQPVPDGVMVDQWLGIHKQTGQAEWFKWGEGISYYQVQERAQMPVKDHLNLLLQDEAVEQKKNNARPDSPFPIYKNGRLKTAKEMQEPVFSLGGLEYKRHPVVEQEAETVNPVTGEDNITITTETRDEIYACLADLLDRTEKHLGMLKIQSKAKDKDDWISQLTQYSNKINTLLEKLK